MHQSYIRPGSAAAAVPAIAATAGEYSSDEILVERIAAGDKLAMQVLFARHRTNVYRWLFRFVGNETDLLPDFRTIDKLRDWLPIRREQCGKGGSRKSRWWRSCARRIAIRFRRWPSGTASASKRSTLGANVSGLCRRATSSGFDSSRRRMHG